MMRGTVLLAVSLLVGVGGCGPGVSDEASSAGATASVPDNGTGTARGLSSAGTVPLPGAEPVPLSTTASPAPLTAALASQDESAPDTREDPPLPEYLVLPDWIARALDSPEVPIRLQALDRWAQQGAQATLDPLIVALDDPNEQVRTRAVEIIEHHWAVEPEAGEGREARESPPL